MSATNTSAVAESTGAHSPLQFLHTTCSLLTSAPGVLTFIIPTTFTKVCSVTCHTCVTWLNTALSYSPVYLWSCCFDRFYARQHICCSAYMPRQFRLSVCLSVTRVYCIKTAERIIEILSPSDRPIILVFRHQGSLRKSDSFSPNGGAKYKGGSKN